MSQFNKYYASYAQYGTTTTFTSVGRSLEVFFLESQRDAWVDQDEVVDGEHFREPVNLRQATAILKKCDHYTVHEPDRTQWTVTKADLHPLGLPIGRSLYDLGSRVISLEEQQELEEGLQPPETSAGS